MNLNVLNTDILIVGGGTAGCYAALTIAEKSKANVLIVEKANVKRSGCLAAGVNALNAYIVKGKEPQDYVDYATWDGDGVVRNDLLLTMANGLNEATEKLEKLGLVILKDCNGEYVTRGNRNIKINGENIKPILSKSLLNKERIKVLNYVNGIDLIVENGSVKGLYAVGVREKTIYIINAKAVICTTGGASGVYKPNNPGFSRHKIWYSPFNTGAGYAMGIRAGAEITSFEKRFIALRCKDTIAPTGTLAQGVGAKQINNLGECYTNKYGNKTLERVMATVEEGKEGRGPSFLKTVGIDEDQESELIKAYFNMAPSQSLKWIEGGLGPSKKNVEIEGTEPYIVGGHTASGYWVDTHRETTIKGLYAAGDVAGSCPQKYVTGALVEGEIAALQAINYIKEVKLESINGENLNEIIKSIELRFNGESSYNIEDLEEEMQDVMDKYAGGITTGYTFTENSLNKAKELIKEIEYKEEELKARDLMDLLHIFELKDRLIVSKVLIEHLRKSLSNEVENKYINSIYKDGKVEVKLRNIEKEITLYEHKN